VNVLACLIAQVEARVKLKLTRIGTHEVEDWRLLLQQASLHIDLIIHPEKETSECILRVLHMPGVSDIFDFDEGRVKLFGMNIDRNNKTAGKTLIELGEDGLPGNARMAMIFRGHLQYRLGIGKRGADGALWTPIRPGQVNPERLHARRLPRVIHDSFDLHASTPAQVKVWPRGLPICGIGPARVRQQFGVRITLRDRR
jgi:hypothetical protein